MAPSPSSPEPRYPVWLGLASFAWAVAGWVLAASAPHLAFVPTVEILHLLLPGITAALILTNLAFSSNALFCRKVPIDRLLLVTGLQIGLFTTLFFQFAAHLGADCYAIQRPTRSWEWVQFSVAHAIRAADVLDAIEAYGWNIQVIKHRGPFVASVVVAYHVIVDLFVLGLFWAMTRRIKARLLEKPTRVAAVFLLGALAFLIWFGVWMAFAMAVRPWRPIDVPLWLAENVVRVVDFADAMDSFDIRWHQVPSGPVESTLTFFCRLWIAIAISLALNWRMARDGVRPPVVDAPPVSPWGLSRLGVAVVLIAALIGADSLLEAGTAEGIAELTAAATGDDEDRASQALEAIRRLGPNARDAIGPMAEARTRLPKRGAKIVETLGHLGPDAIDPLRDIISNGTSAEGEAALASLRRIGPRAAPALVAVWGDSRRSKVKAIAEAGLRDFGVDAMPPLIEATDKANSAVHLHWFNELDRNWTLRGSENRTFLALKQLQRTSELEKESEHEWQTRRPQFRSGRVQPTSEVENAFAAGEFPAWIRDCGTAALPIVDKALSHKNKEVRRAGVEALGASDAPPGEVVPGLVNALKDKDVIVRRLAAAGLGAIGAAVEGVAPAESDERGSRSIRNPFRPAAKGAVAALADVLKYRYFDNSEFDARAETDPLLSSLVKERSEKDLTTRKTAASALGKIGTTEAAAGLVRGLSDGEWEIRNAAACALGAIGRNAVRAVPPLVKALSDDNGDVRRAAASALGMIGPQAKKAVPELTKLSDRAGTAGSIEARDAIERIRGE